MGNIFVVFDGCFLLGIVVNYLLCGSDIFGYGYFIVFDVFFIVL